MIIFTFLDPVDVYSTEHSILGRRNTCQRLYPVTATSLRTWKKPSDTLENLPRRMAGLTTVTSSAWAARPQIMNMSCSVKHIEILRVDSWEFLRHLKMRRVRLRNLPWRCSGRDRIRKVRNDPEIDRMREEYDMQRVYHPANN